MNFLQPFGPASPLEPLIWGSSDTTAQLPRQELELAAAKPGGYMLAIHTYTMHRIIAKVAEL